MDFLNQRKKTVFIVAVLFLIALSIATLNFNRPTFFENVFLLFVVPSQSGVSSVSGWVEERIDFVANLHELERTNQRLIEENQRLLLNMARLELLELENERLTTQLSLRPRYVGMDVVAAYVISGDPNNWSSNFLINRGRRDGVLENMAVVADGGLVGRVLSAYNNSSLVVPIIDDTSAVSAQIRRTGELGFVRGDIRLWEGGFIRMENISADADVLEGDEIITSTLGEIYPHGLEIGIVREIHMDPGGLTKHAIIQPVADFRQLSLVFVVINSLESPLTVDDNYDDEPEDDEDGNGP